MSIAILFDRAKNQKLFIYSKTDERINKLWYTQSTTLLNSTKNELPTSEPLMSLRINTPHEEDTKGKTD